MPRLEDLSTDAVDAFLDAEFVPPDSDDDMSEYFETHLQVRPHLVALRVHIRNKLRTSEYFSWREPEEIDGFVDGFTAAAILLSQPDSYK